MPLIGSYSTADTLLALALSSCFPEDRAKLLAAASRGTYAELLAVFVAYFEIDDQTPTRAIS